MNPVFIFLVIMGAVIIWLSLAGTYRIIGSFTKKHFIDNVKNALDDKPSGADAFIDGFKSSFNGGKDE